MKIIILGTSLGNYNLGVGALAAGVVTCIVEHFPDAEMSFLTFARDSTMFHLRVREKSISVRTIALRMKPYFANNAVLLVMLAAALRLLPIGLVRNWLISRNAVLQHIHESDLIVSIAGGDSFSDIYGLRRLVDVSLPQALVLLMRKGLILLPQTIGPFGGSLAKALGRLIMRHANLIYSRDYDGIKVASDMVNQSTSADKIRFCYDVAFVMQPQRPARIDIVGVSLQEDGNTELVGVNVSGLLFAGGYKRNDAFGFRDKYVDETSKILELLIHEKKVRVLLIPHTLGSGTESDSDVCKALYEALKNQYPGRIGLVCGWHSAPEMKYIISQCDFFIGARMHACIAALSQGIPAVAFSYSRKFIGVMETLGVGKLVIDSTAMPTEQVLCFVGQLFDERRDFRRLLEMRLPEVKSTVLRLFSEISSAASPVVDSPSHSPFPVGASRQ